MGTGIAFCLLMLTANQAVAPVLLDGEFGDIDLGREMLQPDSFPTVTELRAAVGEPQVKSVLMLKLFDDGQHHYHLPVWSQEGKRLAVQRSKVGQNVSKILLYERMSQSEPKLLSDATNVYEYMFRWGINSSSSFVFSRIDVSRNATQICYSPDGIDIQVRTPGEGQYFFPTLYERTDGIRWLAYEHEANLMQQAWDDTEQMEQALGRGTSPRWSRDGRRLLMARQKSQSGVATYEVAIRELKQQTETILPGSGSGVVRSPVWSPDESRVTFYRRGPREGEPWQIVVGDSDGRTPVRTLLEDVVVNPNYRSEGPSWEPSGKRIWSFSHAHRQQEYYPLVAASVDSAEIIVVEYPRKCTNSNDVAVNPVTEVPELAFVAREALTQGLFVVFMNHY